MWKYVSRRLRDTFERSVNHFDKRSTTGITNSPNSCNDEKKKHSNTVCRWYTPRNCWNSYQSNNNTHKKRCNFDHLNCNWIGAITWSSALVLGWYTSKLIHLKLKYCTRDEKAKKCERGKIFQSLHPYVDYINKDDIVSASRIEKIVGIITPTVHSVSKDKEIRETSDKSSSSKNSSDKSDALSEALNSIENRLGVAAIESGQHKSGLDLLRSAANRNYAPALYNLGLCYETGVGVSVDEKMAVKLYRSAASLEHPGALYNLGIYYGQGRGGLTVDLEIAVRLMRLAAFKGQEEAAKALKILDDDSEPKSQSDSEDWRYDHYSYKQEDALSKHSVFNNNVNILHVHNNHATVY